MNLKEHIKEIQKSCPYVEVGQNIGGSVRVNYSTKERKLVLWEGSPITHFIVDAKYVQSLLKFLRTLDEGGVLE